MGGSILSQHIDKHVLGRNPSNSVATRRSFAESYLDSVPREFCAILEVKKVASKALKTLSEIENSGLYSSLLHMFDQELESVSARFRGIWIPRIEFHLLVSKLHLRAVTAVRQASKGDHSLSLPELDSNESNLRGLDYSIQIIALFSKDELLPQAMSPSETSTSRKQMLPKAYFTSLVFAAFFLLKYFACNTNCREQERNIAREHVKIVHAELTKCSMEPRDEMDRAATVIEVLGQQNMATRGAELKIVNRQGASIMFDALTSAAELRHKSVNFDREAHEAQASTSQPYNNNPSGSMAAEAAPDPWQWLPDQLDFGDGMTWDELGFESWPFLSL